MSVSREDVRAMAALARLRFSEPEEDRLAGDLTRILGYVEQLQQVDTADVPPMAFALDLSPATRPDEVAERLGRAEALSVAPDTDGAYVRVPRVIE